MAKTMSSGFMPKPVKDNSQERQLKGENFRLLKNADLSKAKFVDFEGKKSMEKMDTSVELRQSSDYKITECESPEKSMFVKIPQAKMKVYNCITNKEKIVQNPDMPVENHQKYRENYFKLKSSVPKPFHKKLGQFGYFTEKTKTEQDKQRAMKEQLKIKLNHDP